MFTVVLEPAAAGNVAPTANAGPDQSGIAAAATVTLDGSGSADSDGTVVGYAWRQISGTTVTLSSTTVQKPTFTAPTNASNSNAVFGLIVTDNLGAQSTEDTVQVGFVGTGGALLGLRGLSSGSADVQASVTLPAGTLSTDVLLMFLDVNNQDTIVDPVGFTRFHQANLGSGAQTLGWKRSASGSDAASAILINWSTPAKWQAHVEALKNASFTLGDIQVATEPSVDATHDAPSLAIAATGAWVVEHAVDKGSPCSTSMTPTGGGLVSRQSLAQAGNGAFAAATGDTNGTVLPVGTYTGGVWSGTILTNNARVVGVVVYPAGGSNQAPISNAGPDQSNVEPFTTVTLTGAASSDPDGTVATYGWTQLSGPSVNLSSSAVMSPSFLAPGILGGATLVFGLTVVDNLGQSSTQDSVVVGVLTATEFLASGGTWKAYRSRPAHGSAWV